MFAFALHDAREGRLILGRDRLGIKPLFYVRLPDRIAFASEIKALLPILPGQPRVNPVALRQFLQNQFASGEETILEGIRRVPPGEILIVDRDLRIEHRRYWSALDIAPRAIGLDEAQAELDGLMHAAMLEHMRSDVPFGLFLSGGVDSAVLAALLHTSRGRSHQELLGRLSRHGDGARAGRGGAGRGALRAGSPPPGARARSGLRTHPAYGLGGRRADARLRQPADLDPGPNRRGRSEGGLLGRGRGRGLRRLRPVSPAAGRALDQGPAEPGQRRFPHPWSVVGTLVATAARAGARVGYDAGSRALSSGLAVDAEGAGRTCNGASTPTWSRPSRTTCW